MVAGRSASIPEQAFTAALAACHMLWFLDHAARAGFVVASYVDEAEGTLGLDRARQVGDDPVVLRPAVVFAGDNAPRPRRLERLHHAAHAECFIANSVTTEVVVEGA